MSNVTPVLAPFHPAFLVHDIAATRTFYGDILGCLESRSSPDWVNLNSYDHRIVAHLVPDEIDHRKTSAVDGDNVPVRRFDMVLSIPKWEATADKLRAAGIEFIIKPHIRFGGGMGEQITMFFLDPSDNVMEIKAFANMALLFAK